MRLIIWIVAALAALYGGYWAVASRALRAEIGATLDQMRAEGRADYDTLSVGGFPGRFDVTVTEPRLVSSDGTVEWFAPELRVHALSYKPNHVIASLEDTHHLRLGGTELTIRSAGLTMSAVFGLGPDLPLDHAQAVGTQVSAATDSPSGFSIGAADARAAIRSGASPTEQRIGIELAGMELAGAPARLITTGGALPPTGERFYLDAVVGLDRPLDRFAVDTSVRIRAADIRSLTLDWGPAGLTGEGALTLAPDGRPEGRIALSVRNWRAVLQLATALGLVRAETAPTVGRALESLALLGGNPEVLTLPLVFSGGRMSLGPVPLGPAPRF